MHLICVRISDIHSGLGADVAYHGGKRLDIHAVFQRHGGEGVAKVVEAYQRKLGIFQYHLQLITKRVRLAR